MFKAIREYLPHGRPGETAKSTIKEYDTREAAIAYARRYASGARFIRCSVLDADGNRVYEIGADGRESFALAPAEDAAPAPAVPEKHEEPKKAEPRSTEASLPTERELKAARGYVREILETPEEETGRGDFAVKMVFHPANREKTLRFLTKQRAIAYASRVVNNCGVLLQSVNVYHRKEVRWKWQGRWSYQRPEAAGRAKAG